jgi:hypothetical protein
MTEGGFTMTGLIFTLGFYMQGYLIVENVLTFGGR